ncbi:hypothetical protein R6Q59_035300 [Mikania micrantha]
MTCGHQLWTSCGLPCACHISKYLNTETKIPLFEIDIFWTKLKTTNPTLLEEEEEEEIDVIEQMGLVIEEINSKPPEIKRSLIKKVLSHCDREESETHISAQSFHIGIKRNATIGLTKSKRIPFSTRAVLTSITCLVHSHLNQTKKKTGRLDQYGPYSSSNREGDFWPGIPRRAVLTSTGRLGQTSWFWPGMAKTGRLDQYGPSWIDGLVC